MSSINAKTYEPTPPVSVAFLGLGVMGYPMAGHLAKAGHHVTVYTRTAAKSESWLAEFGSSYAHALTPKQAVQSADIVFCCVGNDDDLRSVTLGTDGADHLPTDDRGVAYFAFGDNGKVARIGAERGA